MCIFTYIPLERGLLFTSNRDEVVSRPTAPPDRYPHKGEVLIYPRDLQKGGSWIGMNLTTNTLGVLLNAKTKTPPKPNALSRGRILLDLITPTRYDHLYQKLKHTPPFQCIHCQWLKNKTLLHQIHWDGVALSRKHLDHQRPQLFCANTLYDEPTQTQLKNRWIDWLKKTEASPESVEVFHRKELAQQKNSPRFIKKNKDIQTVSITSFFIGKEEKKYRYYNLLQGTHRQGDLYQ